MKKAIIIDIDNTLLDSSIPFASNNFYANIDLCVKNEWCYMLIEQMSKDIDITTLIITGRDERVKKETERFLKFSKSVNLKLYMRKACDQRHNVDVKKEILEELLTQYNVLFAIDDESPNCDLFKAYGIPTLKVW